MTRDAASGVCTGVTHRAQVLRCNPAHRRANAASPPAEVYGFRARHLRWRHGMAHMIGFIESLCSVQAHLPLPLKPCTAIKMTLAAEKYDRGLFKLCVGVDSAFTRGYACPLIGVRGLGGIPCASLPR